MYKRDKTFLSSIPPEWRDVPIGTVCSLDGETVTYVGSITENGKPNGIVGVRRNTTTGGVRFSRVAWDSLTPLEAWKPKENEPVIAYQSEANLVTRKNFHRHVPESAYPFHMTDGTKFENVARIPEGLLVADADLSVKHWEANGEKFGGDDE